MSILDQLSQIVDLPTIPTTVTHIMEITNREDSTIADLARVVMADQALSAKLLRVANSPFYSMPRKVSDIERAIALLGFREVRDLSLSISVFDSLYMPTKAGAYFDRARFWEHCFVVAFLTRELARAQQQSGGNAFTAGLLHDVGKVFLDKYFPDLFRSIVSRVTSAGISFREAEQTLVGIGHDEVGAFLLKHWNLPDDLAAGAGSHHTPEVNPDPMAVLTFCANTLAHIGGFAATDNEPKTDLDSFLASPTAQALRAAKRLPSEKVLARLVVRLEEEGESLSAHAAMLV